MSAAPTTITSAATDDGPITPEVDAPAAMPERVATVSEWTRREGRYALEAVANAEREEWQRIVSRLIGPSRIWTAGELVRAYRASPDGERRFREEASVLMVNGYVAWLETDRGGAPRGGRLLVGSSLGLTARRAGWWRRHVERTVTWARA
jgi:hypothetical protein